MPIYDDYGAPAGPLERKFWKGLAHGFGPTPEHDAFVMGKVCWGEGFVYMLSDPLLNDFADFIKHMAKEEGYPVKA